MPTRWSQLLLVVDDVAGSGRFYAEVLGLELGHGGDEYEQLYHDGELVMQLHDAGVDDHHGPLARSGVARGNGVLVWFEVDDFDATVERARSREVEVVREVEVNPNAKQREFWFRDPDGYLVVVAGESEHRPRG